MCWEKYGRRPPGSCQGPDLALQDLCWQPLEASCQHWPVPSWVQGVPWAFPRHEQLSTRRCSPKITAGRVHLLPVVPWNAGASQQVCAVSRDPRQQASLGVQLALTAIFGSSWEGPDLALFLSSLGLTTRGDVALPASKPHQCWPVQERNPALSTQVL